MYVKIEDPEFWEFIHRFDYSYVLGDRALKFEGKEIEEPGNPLVDEINARLEEMDEDSDMEYYKNCFLHYVNLLVAVWNGYVKGQNECGRNLHREQSDVYQELGRIANCVAKGRDFYSFIVRNPGNIRAVSPHGEDLLMGIVLYARSLDGNRADDEGFTDYEEVSSVLMDDKYSDCKSDPAMERYYVGRADEKGNGGQSCLFDFSDEAIRRRGLYGIDTCRYVKSLWTRFLIGVRLIGEQCSKEKYFQVVAAYHDIVNDFRDKGELYEEDGSTWLRRKGHSEMVNCYLPKYPNEDPER